MKLMVFSVFDIKAKAYMRPFFMPNQAQASRDFGDAVKAADSHLGKHPEDYSLKCLGFWDDNSGALEPLDNPDHVCNAVDFIGE